MVYNGVSNGKWNPDWDAASNLSNSPWHVPGHLSYLLGDGEVILNDLRDVPFGASDDWIKLFESVDNETLWKLALREHFIFDAVISYVSARNASRRAITNAVPRLPQRVETIGPDLLESLPIEILLYICEQLHASDLCSLSHTSFAKHFFAADILKSRIRSVLACFGLGHPHILLMQECTNAIIAGPALDYLTASAPCDASLDQITRLHFYFPLEHSYWIEYYFATYTDFQDRDGDRMPNYDETADSCISSVRTLFNAEDQEIRLIACSSSNPIEALVSSPYSSRIGCVTHRGLWHGHPASAFSRISIPNRMYVEVGYAHARIFSMAWIRELHAAGYRLTSYFSRRHVCAQSKACPATLRVSSDQGCFNMSFEADIGPSHIVHHHLPEVAWSLASKACPPASTSSTGPLPTSDRKAALWAARWDALVNAALALAQLSDNDSDEGSSMTDDEGFD